MSTRSSPPAEVRRSVLLLVDYYMPGHKAGGPVRTVAGMVYHLGGRFDFRILTRDRDLGDSAPYPGVAPGRWVTVDRAQCRYLAPRELTFRGLRRVITETEHDVLYLNSLFSVSLSIKPLVLRRLGVIPNRRLVLAPRGELATSAVSLKRWKKRAFLTFALALKLYRDVTWQASSAYEEADIRRAIGDGAEVTVAPDLRVTFDADAAVLPRVGTSGPLRIVFVSRISPMKNLDGALQILSGVRGQVRFDIYGPQEDRRYWGRCEALIGALPDNVSAKYVRPLAHSEVGEVVRGYDLFILPSLGENFGHVIIEALSAGCPVLISDRTPWRDLAAHGVGWDLPLDDISAFRAVIDACCKAGESERAAAATRAAAYATTHAASTDDLRSNASLFNR